MTTPGPVGVRYTYYARVGSTDLPVTNIVASMDKDRATYTAAHIDMDWVSDAVFAALDPRTGAKVSWNVEQWSVIPGVADARIGQLPNMTSGGTPQKASMWVRSAERDPINGTASIDLAGGESMMKDKILMEDAPWDTEAWDVRDQIWWSMDDVFGSYNITFDPICVATPIPAGERSHMNPGEDHYGFLQPELDAINIKLRDDWGLWWYAKDRDTYAGTVDLSTYPLAGSDDIVSGYREHITRDGEWHDGVLLKSDLEDFGGGIDWQRSALGGIDGANTRGMYVQRQHAQPSSNAAQKMANRAKKRGYDITVTARCRFDFDAQWQLDVNLPGPVTKSANIRSITWDIGAGTMTIRAQSGSMP